MLHSIILLAEFLHIISYIVNALQSNGTEPCSFMCDSQIRLTERQFFLDICEYSHRSYSTAQ